MLVTGRVRHNQAKDSWSTWEFGQANHFPRVHALDPKSLMVASAQRVDDRSPCVSHPTWAHLFIHVDPQIHKFEMVAPSPTYHTHKKTEENESHTLTRERSDGSASPSTYNRI